MTASFARTAEHIRAEIAAAPDAATAEARAQALSRAFGIGVSLRAAPAPALHADPIAYYDLNRRIALGQLQSLLDGVDFVGVIGGEVWLRLTSDAGIIEMRFPLDQVAARNPHQLLVAMVFSGFLMSLIAFLFLKNQMRPISRLAVAAEAFGRGQVVPYHVAGATEVRAAGHAFLQMRRRIEHFIEQRTLMLSGVSHDLRTPLTRMKLGLSMLDHEPEARALLADVRQMEALIDRFLEFARADVAEEARPVDLRALVAGMVARAGPEVKPGAGIGGGPLVMMLRADLFSRALDNVLANALRYATRAEVRIVIDAATVSVIVEDDGPGIARRQRAEAVKPFVRLDAARNASGAGAGAGLGLAIVADALRNHGGRTRLEEGQTPGLSGLEVHLILPLGLRV
ncbi:MAG TPA: two-component sensor histidine kinase [Paracoccus sp.]|nr:two-component sensor histidine kinase [Paracoccus sp. (in: a-proteobacteria)]